MPLWATSAPMSIKIGMLGTAEIAATVADMLEANDMPLVLDTGAAVLQRRPPA